MHQIASSSLTSFAYQAWRQVLGSGCRAFADLTNLNACSANGVLGVDCVSAGGATV